LAATWLGSAAYPAACVSWCANTAATAAMRRQQEAAAAAAAGWLVGWLTISSTSLLPPLPAPDGKTLAVCWLLVSWFHFAWGVACCLLLAACPLRRCMAVVGDSLLLLTATLLGAGVHVARSGCRLGSTAHTPHPPAQGTQLPAAAVAALCLALCSRQLCY
jgi:hypothetical protein